MFDEMNSDQLNQPHCYRDQLNNHLDNVQGELEVLKEFLRSGGGGGEDYQVDANTLLSVSILWRISFRIELFFFVVVVVWNQSERKE